MSSSTASRLPSQWCDSLWLRSVARTLFAPARFLVTSCLDFSSFEVRDRVGREVWSTRPRWPGCARRDCHAEYLPLLKEAGRRVPLSLRTMALPESPEALTYFFFLRSQRNWLAFWAFCGRFSSFTKSRARDLRFAGTVMENLDRVSMRMLPGRHVRLHTSTHLLSSAVLELSFER